MTSLQTAVPANRIDLPQSLSSALWRGAKGHCPRCDSARLFRAYLKPVDTCPSCGQDWTLQSADDFPAYISILVSGHLMAPIIIYLMNGTNLSSTALAALIVAIAVVMTIGLLQPSKGAVIAAQWWLGLHGFKPDRLRKTPGEG